MNYIEKQVQAFGLIGELVLESFERYNKVVPISERADAQHLTQFDTMLADAFKVVDDKYGPLVLEEGLRVSGVKAESKIFGEEEAILANLVLDFTPFRRYQGQEGEVIPLGYYQEFDLYIGKQDGLPPTLIARYGNSGTMYSTMNPHLSKLDVLLAEHAPFIEAYRRAIFTGQLRLDPIQSNIFGIQTGKGQTLNVKHVDVSDKDALG